MNVYIYQAALLCEKCGKIRREFLRRINKAPDDPDDEYSYDSDEFPKGPYLDGGGESDSPQHCDQCNVYLDNILTHDGLVYVIEHLQEYIDDHCGDPDVLDEWAEHLDGYGMSTENYCVLLNYDELREEEICA